MLEIAEETVIFKWHDLKLFALLSLSLLSLIPNIFELETVPSTIFVRIELEQKIC